MWQQNSHTKGELIIWGGGNIYIFTKFHVAKLLRSTKY